jgi:hypothetical protein
MSINHETWRRVLRWSRAPVRRGTRSGSLTVALVLFLLVGVGAGPAIWAQSPEELAILQRQPQVSRGLPFLPANTVRHAASVYRLEGEEFEVYVVPSDARTDTARAEAAAAIRWEEAPCGTVALERTAGAGFEYLWRVPRDRYDLYVLAEDDFPPVCGFAGSFVEIFEFFLAETPRRMETLRPPPEFPAVIDPRP